MDLIESGRSLLAGVGAVSCGLVAGGFFAFSTFVMPALSRLQPHEGIAAMQAVNSAVVRSPFIVVFLGAGVLCGALSALAVRDLRQPDAVWLLVGGGLYLVGTLAVTGLGNVPLNNTLATVAPSAAEGQRVWARYLSSWTGWNHVRTLAALAAATVYTVASCLGV